MHSSSAKTRAREFLYKLVEENEVAGGARDRQPVLSF